MNGGLTIRFAVLLVGFCVVVTSSGRAKDDPERGCDRTIISSAFSPDHAWSALVYRDVCSHGSAMTTVILEKVRLVRHGEDQNRDEDVLVLDQPSNPAGHPAPEWLTSRVMQITIPNNSIITLKKNKYIDVEVKIKFDPDDPSQRREFLKKFNLPQD
jgi:hypothetical protein